MHYAEHVNKPQDKETKAAIQKAKTGISDTLRFLEPGKLSAQDVDPYLWSLCNKVAKGLKTL